MLAEGEPAPNFTLADQRGEPVTLAGLRGQTVVLYFYPRADTPGCTLQACGVRDRAGEYTRAGVRVIGISPDSVSAIARFDEKHALGFTLLADEDHAVAEAYGTWVEKTRAGRTYWGVQRATLIIAADGTIARVFPAVSPKTHDDEVLGALASLPSR
jgi:thioredoxin-dependent peroxiredoxin